ncbi:hypothetical protein [Paenibacillus faecalis]|uniref:hypothetical protein n=1 Tax=Paenibacillus faecalis TaxID=2079532 RepID=UPI000D10EC0C|nr:hypothetical protein [Paenibacillus faecalis]
MMKLLKYDWKRNANSVLGLMTILLIIEILVTTIGVMEGWEHWVILSTTMLTYGIVSTVLFIIVCRTFDQNIKQYNRRLLPVSPIWSIISSLIQAWISVIVLMSLVMLHLWILWNLEYVMVDMSKFLSSESVLAALVSGWKFTFVIIVVFFSITVARVVGKQSGLWIGILLFFVIQNAVAWVEYKTFSSGNTWTGHIYSINIGSSGTTGVDNHVFDIPIGPLLFEILLVAGFTYTMVYLINRKIEV